MKQIFSDFQIVGNNCLDYWPNPMIQSAVGIFVVFVEFPVPLMILVYCYGRILWVIRARIGSKMGSKAAQTAKFELARNNVVKTLFIVAFFFVICFLGNEVYYLLFGLGFEVNLYSEYYDFTVCLFFLNCTVNPFIYLINYKDFQRALIGLFCCRISGYKTNPDNTRSTTSNTYPDDAGSTISSTNPDNSGNTVSISVGPPSEGYM